MTLPIRRVAVLGAGVMGAGIAAHCANAGLPVLLLDIVKPDLEKLKPVRENENISWRSFWNGPEGTAGPISTTWNVKGWPTLYIIDAKGTIRYKSVGANEDAIDKTLEELLAELKQPAGEAK